jgi:hypothetical protein
MPSPNWCSGKGVATKTFEECFVTMERFSLGKEWALEAPRTGGDGGQFGVMLIMKSKRTENFVISWKIACPSSFQPQNGTDGSVEP